MKIILPIIIILIIILSLIIILNKNIYFSEDFTGNYNQNTIEDFIPSSYLPFNPFLIEQITEYDIIELYKNILNRSPNTEEIKTKIFLTKTELSEELYNSYEYEKMIKIQDNLAISGLENSIARRNLIKKIIKIYKDTYNNEPNSKILMPLKDCFIHLRNNIFLFIVFIQSKNFKNFENDILSTLTLTKKNLLEIFNKHYNLLELKLLAEDKIRLTRGNISLSIENKDINFEILQDELKKLVDENNINNNLENALILNSSNTSNILNNINSSNLNDLPSFNLNTIYDTSNLNLQELKNFFSNQLNKNIEPFSNYDNKKRNQLSLEGTLNNIFNNTKVGNIFTNY